MGGNRHVSDFQAQFSNCFSPREHTTHLKIEEAGEPRNYHRADTLLQNPKTPDHRPRSCTEPELRTNRTQIRERVENRVTKKTTRTAIQIQSDVNSWSEQFGRIPLSNRRLCAHLCRHGRSSRRFEVVILRV